MFCTVPTSPRDAAERRRIGRSPARPWTRCAPSSPSSWGLRWRRRVKCCFLQRATRAARLPPELAPRAPGDRRLQVRGPGRGLSRHGAPPADASPVTTQRAACGTAPGCSRLLRAMRRSAMRPLWRAGDPGPTPPTRPPARPGGDHDGAGGAVLHHPGRGGCAARPLQALRSHSRTSTEYTFYFCFTYPALFATAQARRRSPPCRRRLTSSRARSQSKQCNKNGGGKMLGAARRQQQALPSCRTL